MIYPDLISVWEKLQKRVSYTPERRQIISTENFVLQNAIFAVAFHLFQSKMTAEFVPLSLNGNC